MLKPIALGLLSMTAACTGAALANDPPNPNFYIQSWNKSYTFTPQYGKNVFTDEWQQVLDDPQLPYQLKQLCQSDPKQCDVWADWAQSTGIWIDSGKHPPPRPAPEVNPAGAMGALTILALVLAMVRGRRLARKPA